MDLLNYWQGELVKGWVLCSSINFHKDRNLLYFLLLFLGFRRVVFYFWLSYGKVYIMGTAPLLCHLDRNWCLQVEAILGMIFYGTNTSDWKRISLYCPCCCSPQAVGLKINIMMQKKIEDNLT